MSTPTMIGMMEMAAIDAIRAYYEPGETSVGAGIDGDSYRGDTTRTYGARRGRGDESGRTPPGIQGRAFDEVEQIGSGDS